MNLSPKRRIFAAMTLKSGSWTLAALLALIALTALPGCDPCRKLRKSKNLAERDSAAFCYYERKQYETASQILDELRGLYRGTDRAEKVNLAYAYCKYHLNEKALAALFFSDFIRSFPNSPHVEEATWMIAQSHYSRSSSWELDQTDTHKALEFLQLYLQQYNRGEHAAQAQQYMAELRDKLAYKAFKQADLYYRMRRYRSAIFAFQNLLADYPDSKYRIEAAYKHYRCTVLYADESVPEKQAERYLDASNHYLRFIEKYPSSKYLRDAESLYAYVQAQLARLGSSDPQVKAQAPSQAAPAESKPEKVPKPKRPRRMLED